MNHSALIKHLDGSGIDVVNVEPPDGMDITGWASINPRLMGNVVDVAPTIRDAGERRCDVEIDL